jgi:hypothetical protein
MPAPREPRSIIEAAEQAAAAGNYASAEALLHEAALVQEAGLGPLHPDLAKTLNNLGVVCEITGNLIEAGRSFRRAFAIATTALGPDHPFVATSRKNLRDFCEAQGTPFELPPPTPTVTAQATPWMEPPRESQIKAESQAVQPHARRRSIRPLVIGALGPLAMLIMILAPSGPWLDTSERAESSSVIATEAPREIPAPLHAPSSVKPIPVPDEATKATGSWDDGVSVNRITPASTPARTTVLEARLCADLDEWSCDPPDDPVTLGPLFFYTQVKSTSETTVQHRWYLDNRLNQSVALRVEANPSGYRTYSRSMMNSDSTGNWRVELRAEDGRLLHERRFSVR